MMLKILIIWFYNRENGDLKISLNKDGVAEVNDYGIDEIKFYNFFEDIQCNSEYMYFDNLGESGLGMSDAPCITYGYYIDDDSKITDNGNSDSEIFIYSDYAVKDFTKEIVDNVFVIFNTMTPKTKEEIEDYRLKKILKTIICEKSLFSDFFYFFNFSIIIFSIYSE